MGTGQRVVPRNGDVLRDSGVHTLSVVSDRRRLSVENLASLCYCTTEDGEDALPEECQRTDMEVISCHVNILSHAYTQNGNLAAKVLDELFADS